MPDTGLVHAFRLDGAGGGARLGWDGLAQPGTVWVHLDYSSPDARAWLDDASGLDPVVRAALLDADPRPRALVIGDALLLVVRAINLNAGAEPEDMVSLRCWIERERILTLRHRTVRTVKEIADDLAIAKGPVSAADFVVQIVERSLEPVVACVDGIDEHVSRAEDDLLGPQPADLRPRIAGLRRRAIALRRFIAPQRDAFARLAAATLTWFDDGHRARLREAGDRLTRTVEELDAARDRAAVTHEELASRQGEVTNQRLYVLSMLSALFLPLGFITAVFGVSVGGVPGSDAGWGFWAVLGILATVGILQLWLFRRWKWL
jgi:zinc transporter